MIYIINKGNKKIFNILKLQKYDSYKKYIFSPYIIKIWKENNLLLRNLLTQESIMLKNSNEEDEKFLITHWFKIEQELNPYDLFQKIKKEGNESHKNINNYNLLTDFDKAIIYTTLDCNANCYYCYEKHQCFQRKNMTKEVADKLINLIIQNKPKKFFFSWFGGEPLFNYQIIDYIIDKIKENNIDYVSSMISNAILFTPEMIERAVKKWKLRNIQITVDGIYENYEKIKDVPKGSFERLANNIDLLIQNKVKVSIRLNITPDNLHELKKAVLFFKKYKGNQYFSIYTHEIFDTPLDKQKKIFYNKRVLNEYIHYYCGHDPKIIQWQEKCCMADQGKCVGVLPDGELNICEHCIDHDHFSNLDQDFYDINVINKFTEISDRKECQLCPLRPSCIFLHECGGSSGNHCSQYRVEDRLLEHKLDLISSIENKLNQRKRRLHLMITRNLYTNLDIYNKAMALVEAFNTKEGKELNYPVKINYYLQKNIKAFVDAATEIEQKRIEIVQKYGNKKEDSEEYIIPEDKMDEAGKELQDFFELEQEIPVSMLKLDWFDNIDMTAEQVSAISFMIEEEE